MHVIISSLKMEELRESSYVPLGTGSTGKETSGLSKLSVSFTQFCRSFTMGIFITIQLKSSVYQQN